MKKIIALVIKDTLVRFTSPLEWVFFLILPIIFTLVIGATAGPSDDSRVKVYVVDQAQNTLSETLIETLEKSSSIRPEVKPLEEALSDFDQRKVTSVLIIPEGFTENALLQQQAELELRQLPNNTDSMVVSQAVQSVLERVGGVVDIANASVAKAESLPGFTFDSAASRKAYFDQSREEAQILMEEAPDRIHEVDGNTEDPIVFDAKSSSSAGQMITWVFIPLIGLCATFAYERQKGTLRRLLTTPTSKALFLFATIAGQVLTALVQMVLLVLFGVFVMKLNWGHDLAALALILVTSALAAAALGTIMATFVKTEAQGNGLSIMIGMVMALMGGCWYPLELFPRAVQQAVKILPTTWSMQGMLDIVQRGLGVTAILPEAAVLTGFALVFFVIGILRFKYE